MVPTVRRAFAVAALLIAATVADSGNATPVYTIEITGQGPVTGGTLQADSFSDGTIAIEIVAGPAGLGASVQSNGTPAFARATLLIHDVVISGPTDFVTSSLNLHLSGSLGLSPSGSNTVNGAYVRIDGGWFTGLVNPCVSTLPGMAGCGGGAFPEFYTAGILESVTGTTASTTINDTFGSPARLFPVNTPFSIGLILEAAANATPGTSAYAAFLHTLSFATDGPVFDLPAGFTVNSVDGGIVDNRFFPSPVPLPGTLLLLSAGLAGLAGLVRIGTRRRMTAT